MGAHGDEERAQVRYRIDSLAAQVTRSMDGHFVAVGDDRRKSSNLLTWCGRISASFERRTGGALSFQDRSITVVVRPNLLKESGAGVWVDPPVRSIVGRGLKQRLWLASYEQATGIAAERLLTELLLGAWREEGAWRTVVPPAWVVRGLHRTLLPETRALDVDEILGQWQRGQLESLPSLLLKLDGVALVPATADEAVLPLETALMSWLEQELGARLLPLVRQACMAGPAQGVIGQAQLLVWLQARDGSELDARWERWLLGRRRAVVVLGAVTRRQLSDYQSELLLYAGSCGIPLGAPVRAGVGFDSLPALRDRPWMAEFCHLKQARLRVLAAGRGEELLHVTDLYDTFLAALRFSDDEAAIRRALEAAAKAFGALWVPLSERSAPATTEPVEDGGEGAGVPAVGVVDVLE